MPLNRRNLLCLTLAGVAGLSAGNAQVTPPIIEIIAFAHPPVQSALKPLRDWLPSQGNKLRVVEIDMESQDGQRRVQALGLKGHLPIVIAVNGQLKHKRADGSSVEFVSFPAGTNAAPGAGWTMEDLKAALATSAR